MQTKLKVHRDKIVIYYSYKKKIFRETTPLVVPKKDISKVTDILKSGRIPIQFEDEIGSVLERKTYCDGLLCHLINKSKRTPTVAEFKKLLSKQPINLNETKVVTLFKEHLEETKTRFTKGTNSIDSIKDYKSFFNLLQDYELEKDVILQYSDLNADFVTELYEFMRNKRLNTIYKQYRTVGGLKGRTIKKRFDNLKFFTRWLDKKMSIHVDNEVRDAITTFKLNKEELNSPVKRYALNKEAIKELEITIPQTENERIAKDIFLVSCFTSLRFSDLISIRKNHLKFENERYVINKQAVKTAAKMKIPLKDEIYQIIKRYDHNLDLLSNGMLNKSLKQLLRRSEFFQQESSDYYKKDGSPYKLHEIISCHTGRRTMISRLLNEFGVPPAKVMKISGHKSIRSLNQYIFSEDLELDMNLL